jgi:hypothetical protein
VTVKKARFEIALALMLCGRVAAAAPFVDQSLPGKGNAEATRLAASSALVSSAQRLIASQIAKIGDHSVAAALRELVADRDVCVKHRAGETAERKQKIIQALGAAGLLTTSDAANIPGGALAGVLPPVLDAGSACPHLPQPFAAAPGSSFGGHHSYPGGLVLHSAANDLIDVGLASAYRRVYGHSSAGGLPVVGDGAKTDVELDEDVILAAPLLHDWAKTLVFQWNADGTEFTEMSFGGNGQTDNNGAPGDSRTGAHHIIGLAESMARDLPPKLILAQAAAHAPAVGNGEYKVVNWLRAAAIIAGVDPVARHYLHEDAAHHLRLAAVERLGDVDLNAAVPSQANAAVEYQLHNLSDADYVQTTSALDVAQLLLAQLAPDFGFDRTEVARYNLKYRNPVLSHTSAERLYLLYTSGGIEAVRSQLAKLKAKGLI